jgi:hypothetical protein
MQYHGPAILSQRPHGVEDPLLASDVVDRHDASMLGGHGELPLERCRLAIQRPPLGVQAYLSHMGLRIAFEDELQPLLGLGAPFVRIPRMDAVRHGCAGGFDGIPFPRTRSTENEGLEITIVCITFRRFRGMKMRIRELHRGRICWKFKGSPII